MQQCVTYGGGHSQLCGRAAFAIAHHFQAVAFNGRNVTNVVYFDGQTLHIIEAKGGAGKYGDRLSVTGIGDTVTNRISQTDGRYPLDVAHNMRSSRISDGRNAIGRIVERSYSADTVRYSGVRTSGHQTGESASTVVEHIFRTPTS